MSLGEGRDGLVCRNAKAAWRPWCERMEARVLFHAHHHVLADVAEPVTDGGGVVDGGNKWGLDAVPALSSDPAGGAKVYLDFTGAGASRWGSYDVPATAAYDVDGDPATFSDGELANIREIWARVAEKYSPFNVDVTTVDPGVYGPRTAVRVVVGGDGAWYGAVTGGAAFVGSFAHGPSTVWVFSKNLANGDPHYTGEAVSHETGHAMGLEHQSTFDAAGNRTAEYERGNSRIAPVMGYSYAAERGIWWDGASGAGGREQDDLAVIAGAGNGFGYRADDHGDSAGEADLIGVGDAGVVGAAGVIERTSDADVFAFYTGAGAVDLSASVAGRGAMLDLKLSLVDAAGNVVAAADTGALGERITVDVGEGWYYLVVASHGGYGDVGQYSVSGTIVPGQAPAGELAVASAVAGNVGAEAPEGLAGHSLKNAKGKDTGVFQLGWAGAEVASGFRIEWSGKGKVWKTVADVGGGVHEYTWNGGKKAGAGVFRVTAIDAGGEATSEAAPVAGNVSRASAAKVAKAMLAAGIIAQG